MLPLDTLQTFWKVIMNYFWGLHWAIAWVRHYFGNALDLGLYPKQKHKEAICLAK
jgi:hypothetical protein